MVRASYTMSSEYMGYFFAVMLVVSYVIILMFSLAIDPNPMKVYLILLLISLLGMIMIIIFLMKKMSYKPHKVTDYSLK